MFRLPKQDIAQLFFLGLIVVGLTMLVGVIAFYSFAWRY